MLDNIKGITGWLRACRGDRLCKDIAKLCSVGRWDVVMLERGVIRNEAAAAKILRLYTVDESHPPFPGNADSGPDPEAFAANVAGELQAMGLNATSHGAVVEVAGVKFPARLTGLKFYPIQFLGKRFQQSKGLKRAAQAVCFELPYALRDHRSEGDTWCR